MKKLVLALLVSLFSFSAFAFPASNINFVCPNTFAGTVLSIPLTFDSATGTWTGYLVETREGRDVKVGPITASLKANPQNLEISLRGGVIGVMTQVLEHHGIYRDGNFVLQCSF